MSGLPKGESLWEWWGWETGKGGSLREGVTVWKISKTLVSEFVAEIEEEEKKAGHKSRKRQEELYDVWVVSVLRFMSISDMKLNQLAAYEVP